MSDIIQQIIGAVIAIAIALAGAVAYFWGTNWLLDRFLSIDQRDRRRDRPAATMSAARSGRGCSCSRRCCSSRCISSIR